MKKIQLGGHRKPSKIKGYALVDDRDYENLNKFKWCINDSGYAVRKGEISPIRMHNFIIGKVKGMDIDHINRNRLDNRRFNLRVVTRSKNLRNGVNPLNTSGVRGVYWHKSAQKWCSEFKIEKKKIYLGLFTNIALAKKAYSLATEKYGY